MRRSRRRRVNLERLERRQLLAGDLVGHWLAQDLAGTYENGQVVTEWTDRVSQITALADGSPSFNANSLGGRPTVGFDASDARDWFVVPKESSPVSNANDFTIAVLFSTSDEQLNATTSNWYDGTSVVHANQQGFNKDWGITLHGNGQAAAGIGKGFLEPTTSVFSSRSMLNDGESHLIVFARNGSELLLYVDDAEPEVATGADEEPRRNLDMFIGSPTSVIGGFSGAIAEVRVFDGALSAGEVNDLRAEIDQFYGNSAPQAVDDFYAVDEDGVLLVTPNLGVLANDSDADEDDLTALVLSEPSNGTAGLLPNGSFIYRPTPDFFGTDTFTYAAVDFRPSAPATVTVEVSPAYDPFVGVGDSYKAIPSQPLVVEASNGVLSNDLHVDQTPVTVSLAQDASAGSLTLATDGSFTYDPEGFSGTATFAYRVDDGTQLSEPITVTLIVNTTPTVVNDTIRIKEDESITLSAAEGPLSNDVDADGDSLLVTIVEPPMHGAFQLSDNGELSYTPHENFFGTDRLTYFVHDGVDDSEIATVEFLIEAVNDHPLVVGEGYFLQPTENLSIDANRGLLRNDSDVEDTELLIVGYSSPENGSVTVNGDGSFEYISNREFVGVDTFTYEVRDSDGAGSTAAVEIYSGTSPLRLSEIMAANGNTLVTSIRTAVGEPLGDDLLTPDWIEIENLSSGSFDLSGFSLSDDETNLQKWQFPTGITIEPNAFLVVLATRLNLTDPELDENGLLHTNFKLSSDPDEFVGLALPDGQLIDSFSEIPSPIPDVSYGITNEAIATLSSPSPGNANSPATLGIVENVTFSHPRGFYEEAFQLELSVATADAEIFYTLDGSMPTCENGMRYEEPISVTTTTNVRAIAFKDNHIPSRPGTQSYLFTEAIIQQPNLPEGFPDRWGRAGRADYEMDPRVVSETESEFYDPLVADALRVLPSISITMDPDEFFGPDGLQANSTSHGDEWERATSLEFIDFEQLDGDVQVDTGIRMVGNASRAFDRRKHNMRLAFRDDYGAPSLDLPLFGINEQESHQNLILRGGNGDSWVNAGTSKRAQYIRDQWQRDLQVEMGHLTTSQLYAHLYINGLYWGMYHVFERHDAAFLALHLGGSEEDYDAIKDVNGNTAAVDAVSGDTDRWLETLSIANDLDRPLDERFAEIEKRVDLVNMIDYLLINFYAANGDWDHNNFRTGSRRDETGRFQFFSWDAERADINRTNDQSRGEITIRNGDLDFNGTNKNNAGRPTRIHQRLSEHEEYRTLFADRVQKHFFNQGALTPEGVSRLWNARADEIRPALPAESARWGDLHSRTSPRTVAHWESVLDIMNEQFFPVRTGIVLEQLERRDLLLETPAPSFSSLGGEVEDGMQLAIETSTTGIIYFTRDGSDPRQRGGDVSENALVYTRPLEIASDTHVQARVWLDGEWSALMEAEFLEPSLPADADSLRISEIHYNPADPSDSEIAAGFTDNDDFEFIELVNIAEQPIELSFTQFVTVDGEGISFDFSRGDVTRLRPHESLIVVEDIDAFRFRYGDGFPIAGQWTGRLNNGGELLTLIAGEEKIHEFSFDDDWYPETDGIGASLEVIDPFANPLESWGLQGSWRASAPSGGTPGTFGPTNVVGDSNRDGVFNSSDLVLVFQAGEYEDEIDGNSTFEEGDWNGDGDFDSADLVFAFQVDLFESE